MINNKCALFTSNNNVKSTHTVNTLKSIINDKAFNATIVGGRYDGDENDWERRSWGRGPLTEGSLTHALIFISLKPQTENGKTYDLSDSDIPVSIHFTNLFPADDGDEFEYLVKVNQGELTLTHDFSSFLVTGTFSFSVNIEQPDGTELEFFVKQGELSVGPS